MHRYFKNWADSGVFRTLFKVLGYFLNENGLIDRQIQVVDGSIVFSLFLPRKQAFVSVKYSPKRAVKFSLLVDGQGQANEHDTNLLSRTLEDSIEEPRKNAEKSVFLGDKGYVGSRQMKTAAEHGMIGVFPQRKNQSIKTSIAKKKLLRENRFIVERTIGWMKNLRRLKFCYEKSVERYKAFLDLGCSMLVFKKAFL